MTDLLLRYVLRKYRSKVLRLEKNKFATKKDVTRMLNDTVTQIKFVLRTKND